MFARDLINTLRRRELDEAASKLSAETGLTHRRSTEGDNVSGVYRQRVTLASGRFAMIDDGLGFQLVPWRPALEQKLGQQVSGTLTPGGGIDWSFQPQARTRHVVAIRCGSQRSSARSDLEGIGSAGKSLTSSTGLPTWPLGHDQTKAIIAATSTTSPPAIADRVGDGMFLVAGRVGETASTRNSLGRALSDLTSYETQGRTPKNPSIRLQKAAQMPHL